MKRIFTICVPDDCYLKVANIVAVVEKNDHSENGMTVFIADNNDEGQEWLFVTNGKAKKVVDLQPIESEERKKSLEVWIPLEYDGYADGNPVWDKWECSKCGWEHSGDEESLTAFCPNCGARMEVVKDES